MDDAVFHHCVHLKHRENKMMNEQELSEQCRKGNNIARQQLYETYADHLMALCYRYIGERDTARDVLHDGFLKIFQTFDKFTYRGKGSLRAWTDRVMINEALQFLRHKDVSMNTVSIDEQYDLYDCPETEQIDRIPEKVLMQYIAELPTGYRTVFNLFIFEEKSHREIAELLHINEKSSSSQLFRAKSILADRIKEWIKNNE